MKYVRLGSTELLTSALGFGCSALGGRIGRTQSLRALALAFERGVTYYDTARSYGYGASEKIVGEFTRGKRDRVLIATKFGIVPRRSIASNRLIKGLARNTFALLPRLKGTVQKSLGDQFQRSRFSAVDMLSSLEQSLRELRTDYVDVMLMHACGPGDLSNQELATALQKVIQSGRVRYVGIASGLETVPAALREWRQVLSVVQFPFNLAVSIFPETVRENPWWQRVGKLGYQPFGGEKNGSGMQRWLAELAEDSSLSPETREKLHSLDGPLMADAALNGVLCGTGIHVVLCSMLTPQHLVENVAAVENSRFSSQELKQLRERMAIVGVSDTA